jgi:uncharacterized protein YceK
MKQRPRTIFLWILVASAVGLDSCATIRTMPSLATPEHPKIYSGARLDLNAIAKNEESLKKFKAEAPEHPLIDFPFSAILDTVILPITFSVSSYEFLFGR